MTKRANNRKNEELRPIKITLGVVESADGSCYLEWGKNIILATVHGPRQIFPKHLANPEKAVIDYKYRMAPFSVTDRKSPVPGKRDKEISLVSGYALESARNVMLQDFSDWLWWLPELGMSKLSSTAIRFS